MKRQQNAPAHMLPTPAEKLLREIKWLDDTPDDVTTRIFEIAESKEYHKEENMVQEGDESDGIYLVVSGLVRVLCLWFCTQTARREYTAVHSVFRLIRRETLCCLMIR